MNRGDVLLVRFPHPSGGRGKKRPVVVVQADTYNKTANARRRRGHYESEPGQ